MNDYIFSQLFYNYCSLFSLAFIFCIQYDNNILLYSPSIQANRSWLENQTSRIIWRNMPRIWLGSPLTHMSSERLSQFSSLRCLVSIWSQLAQCLADPKQVSAASRPNSGPTAEENMLPRESEAADNARTCHPSKKLISWNHFSKEHVQAFQSWRLKSAKRMKRQLAKKSQPPRSTVFCRAMAGAHPPQILRLKIEGNYHERFGQKSRSSFPPSQSSSCLVHLGLAASRRNSCRPYLRAIGGAYRCFSQIS